MFWIYDCLYLVFIFVSFIWFLESLFIVIIGLVFCFLMGEFVLMIYIIFI